MYSIWLMAILPFHTIAQTDTEFWFVAPNITEGHGDQPVVFHFTAFDVDASLTITQPANPTWSPINLHIPAGQSRAIDLTVRLSFLENQPAYQVLNKGIHIQSDQPVTAYYEVNHMFNPDIFALKGRNALGKEFYIPAQDYFQNAPHLNPIAFSAIDIVATQNDTRITITPSVDVRGHRAGSPFEIFLDRGQTYSVEAIGVLQYHQLTGTHVESDQLIAITLKHDSNVYDPCYDLSGDQIVPVDVLGTEYIVVKGFLQGGDHVFISAVEDGTRVEIIDNESSDAQSVLLQGGESHRFLLRTSSAFIKSDAPVYVMHMTGFGCELGMALLPKLDCTGSQSVSFNRSTSENFGVILIVETGNEDSFVITPDRAIPSGLFKPVPGSGGRYVSARIDLTSPALANQAFQITNTKGSFHLGTINGGDLSGTRYGYFSDFKTLKILTKAGKICLGSEIQLKATGGDQYYWFGDPTIEGKTTPEISVDPEVSTEYGVVGSNASNECLDTAYLEVEVFEWAKPEVDISHTCTDVEVSMSYAGTAEVESMRWIIDRDTFITTAEDTFKITWNEPSLKELDIMVTNPAGCSSDTTYRFEVGGFVLGLDSSLAITLGDSLSPDPSVIKGDLGSAASILWTPTLGTSCSDCFNPAFDPPETTTYELAITDTLGCVTRYYTTIYVDIPLYVPNAFSPNNDGINDVFTAYGENSRLEKMIIADRWGQIVYDSNSENPFWDGKISGSDGAIGTYIYYLRGVYLESQTEFEIKGSFTLLR